MLLLHGKNRQKEMNIENTFSELKKKPKKTLFYYQHLAVSLFLIIF